MKKVIKLLLSFLLSALMFSCASTKIDPSFLEGQDALQITQISFTMKKTEPYTLKEWYESIDFAKMEQAFYEKFGVNLKHDLFTEDDYKNFEPLTNTTNDSSNLDYNNYDYYMNTKESDQKNIVQLYYNVESRYGYPIWSIYVDMPNKKTVSITGDDRYWTYKHQITDKENSAIVQIKKDLFIQRINDCNALVFFEDNVVDSEAKEKTYYFPAGEKIKIYYSVYEKGFAFVSSLNWDNQTEEITLEKGKTYVLGYKIDRSHFFNTARNVALEIKEQ